MHDAEYLLWSWARDIIRAYPKNIEGAKRDAARNRNIGVSLYILATYLWISDGGNTFVSWLAVLPFLIGTSFLVARESSNKYVRNLEEKYVQAAWLMGREDYASVISLQGWDNSGRHHQLSQAGIDLSERIKLEGEARGSAYLPS